MTPTPTTPSCCRTDGSTSSSPSTSRSSSAAASRVSTATWPRRTWPRTSCSDSCRSSTAPRPPDPEDVFTRFDDYAARFARGEAPALRGYLTRAGESAGELGRLVDAFLARASPPEPDEERVALARAWVEGQPPLLELRT